MNRAILIMIIALGLAGCKNPAPSVDPFFGRTTVPPPSTGSISGQTADPYYRPGQPVQAGPLQANTTYNPGGISSNPANAPSYSGSNLTGSPNTPAPGSQPAWPNTANPTGAQPGNYSPQYAPGLQNTPTQPASRQSAPTGSATPGTYPNQYAPSGNSTNNQYLFPPGGNTSAPAKNNLNYNNSYPGNTGAGGVQTAPSPNRITTPYFAGGTPNRTTLSASSGNTGMVANSAGVSSVNNQPNYNRPNYNQNINSFQNNFTPQNNNYLLPASRQSTSPSSTTTPDKTNQPVWRESTSSDDRIVDGDVQLASGAESKDN